MSVFVLNQRNQPLMPTTPSKARKLLKQGNAKVVKRTPFTIQLLIATGETKQEMVFEEVLCYIEIKIGYKNNM